MIDIGPIVQSEIWKEDLITSDIWYEPLAAKTSIDYKPEPLVLVEDEFQQAIYIALLTDRRQTDDQVSDTINNNPSGWWYDDLDGELSGSYLYTLLQGTISDNTPSIIQEMVLEALEFLDNDSIASDIAVEVLRVGSTKVRIKVIVFKDDTITNKFSYLWDNLEKTLTIG